MEDLRLAAKTGDIDKLYEVIAKHPKLLADIDEIPLINTPLHIAAEAGCTHFAVEMMLLKPSFCKKLNPDGLTPLDVALRKDQTETVRRLIEIDSELIRNKGKKGWTPLHYVAQTDNFDLLADFLVASPLSIKDLTIQKQTALHIAASNGKFAAIQILVGWAKRTENQDVLTWQDERGNTALHVVASNHQHYANNLRHALVILSKEIRCAEKNGDGLKPLDIILASEFSDQQKEEASTILGSKTVMKSLSEDSYKLPKHLRSRPILWEKIAMFDMKFRRGLTTERVNIIVVVAALIITTSYQAALQSPVGLRDVLNLNKYSNTTDVLQHKKISKRVTEFHLYNSLTFYSSLAIIHFLLEFTPASVLLHLTLIYFGMSFSMLVRYRDNSALVVNIVTFGLLGVCVSIFIWKTVVSCALFMLISKHSSHPIAKRYMEMQQNVKL